jgi:hypothetical protein
MIADALLSTLGGGTPAANAPVNNRMYVPQRPVSTPDRPNGKIADVLASTHACTTAADALVNYRMYVPRATEACN